MLNGVTLNKDAPTKKFVLQVSAVSVFVLIVLGMFVLEKSTIFLITATYVLMVWIIGAIASRSLLSVEKIFYGRIRDGISSLVIGIMAVATFELQSTITIGVTVGALWALWVSRFQIERYFSKKNDVPTRFSITKTLIYSNISPVIIQLWALYFNNYESKLYGLEPVMVVRISMYVFQFLSIGVVVLVAHIPSFLLKINRFALACIYGGLIFGIIVSVIAPSYGVLIMPITAAIANYTAVAYLRGNN